MGKSARKLKFREDGTFTIAQFTDIHWIDGSDADMRSRALMDKVILEERPDLVVYTGDVIYTGKVGEGKRPCLDPAGAFRDAVSSAERNGIPWAVVFGNHDTEQYITREQLASEVERFEYAVSSRGPENVAGYSNFVLELEGKDGSAAALYGFDTGAYSVLPHVKGYDWIRRNQIEWYLNESRLLSERNGGNPLPALAFFHIPLPEYRQAWENATCYGNKYEEVCSPQLNSGLFSAMVEAGDIVGTFCGHDHVNDYWGELNGIRLCYGRATGYNTYGRDGFSRGARLIRLREGERNFETWLRLDDETVEKEQLEHIPSLR
ncbi:metallophosphoesterase [Paenibacillus hemerocallicola]|uniref:Metallophosphoesterase n=1 Tax=Paenibacillus hemerocallicola TaxID=1172614 RepID=A0A5C4SW96_9BACL|nr:metallophosphoesterase family protein [Paenibacillus hemerocallicola]TNJ57739.1 metallophosphoesterase [Paenibacillus hemerocallicola]